MAKRTRIGRSDGSGPGAARALAVAAALGLIAVWARPAAAPILAQVMPNQLTMTVGPGQYVERSVIVSNLGTETVSVRTRLSDWTLGADGDLGLAPLGSTPGTLLGALSWIPEEMVLSPGAVAAIRLTGELRAGGRATRWGMLLCEVRPLNGNAAAGAELGATVFVTSLPPDQARGEIVGVAVLPLGGDSVQVIARVRNSGERHFTASGEIAIADSAGHARAGGSLESGLVLPGMTRNLSWWGSFPHRAGPYVVTATIDTGEPELLAGELPVAWPLAAPLERSRPEPDQR